MGIVPSRLHRVRIFESVTVSTPEDEGYLINAERTTPSIEQQIDDWVSKDKCLVVATGPVSLNRTMDVGNAIIDTRTLPVIYVPPVEQGDRIHGEQTDEIRETTQPAHTSDAATDPGISDGGEGLGGNLSVPDFNGTVIPVGPSGGGDSR